MVKVTNGAGGPWWETNRKKGDAGLHQDPEERRRHSGLYLGSGMLDAIVVIWSSQKSAVLDNIGSGLLTRKKGQGWERTNETFSHICCQITAELDSINLERCHDASPDKWSGTSSCTLRRTSLLSLQVMHYFYGTKLWHSSCHFSVMIRNCYFCLLKSFEWDHLQIFQLKCSHFGGHIDIDPLKAIGELRPKRVDF